MLENRFGTKLDTEIFLSPKILRRSRPSRSALSQVSAGTLATQDYGVLCVLRKRLGVIYDVRKIFATDSLTANAARVSPAFLVGNMFARRGWPRDRGSENYARLFLVSNARHGVFREAGASFTAAVLSTAARKRFQQIASASAARLHKKVTAVPHESSTTCRNDPRAEKRSARDA